MTITQLHAALAAQNAAALVQLTELERHAMLHDCVDCGEDATGAIGGKWYCDWHMPWGVPGLPYKCEDCDNDASHWKFGLWLCADCTPAPHRPTIADWFDDAYFDLQMTQDDMSRGGW